MNDRPTPKTDETHRLNCLPSTPQETAYRFVLDLSRRLERERDATRDELDYRTKERDEAWDAIEKARAYKRVMKRDNAKLRRERDDALLFNMRASRDASLYASMLHEKLDAERALADRLGHLIERLSDLSPLIYAHAMDDLTAWEEARR